MQLPLVKCGKMSGHDSTMLVGVACKPYQLSAFCRLSQMMTRSTASVGLRR